jgi:tight adherence protein B
MAIRIQRTVGGNLADVLLTTAQTMRERAQVHRQVRALTAEGRLSAYILVALPIGVGGLLFLTKPDYMRPLVTERIGIVMLVVAGLLVAVGGFWMSRLIKVEV